MKHPLYGTNAWRDMVLAGRLPCEDHPKGCRGLVTLPMPWPFSGLRDEPCLAPSWCWCGEPCEEAGRMHEACWRARYAVAFAVDALALAFAPLDEARLVKAFR